MNIGILVLFGPIHKLLHFDIATLPYCTLQVRSTGTERCLIVTECW